MPLRSSVVLSAALLVGLAGCTTDDPGSNDGKGPVTLDWSKGDRRIDVTVATHKQIQSEADCEGLLSVEDAKRITGATLVQSSQPCEYEFQPTDDASMPESIYVQVGTISVGDDATEFELQGNTGFLDSTEEGCNGAVIANAEDAVRGGGRRGNWVGVAVSRVDGSKVDMCPIARKAVAYAFEQLRPS